MNFLKLMFGLRFGLKKHFLISVSFENELCKEVEKNYQKYCFTSSFLRLFGCHITDSFGKRGNHAILFNENMNIYFVPYILYRKKITGVLEMDL